MANNELDAILAEIRKKAQENDIPEQTPEAEQLPVEVVDAPAAEPKPEKEDVFSDILKAVGAAETKQPAPAPAPAVPQEEPKAPADVPDEAPESIFNEISKVSQWKSFMISDFVRLDQIRRKMFAVFW